ncbi:MAG: hypothetical protein ACOC3V_00680 [bacterium]
MKKERNLQEPQKQALNIPVVSNRRELLIAFADFLKNEKNTQFIYTFWIDEFLSKQ